MSKSVGNVLDPLAVIEGRSWEQILQDIEDDHEAELGLLRKKEGGEQRLKAMQKAIRNQVAEAKKLFQDGIPESGADPLRMALIDYTRQVRGLTSPHEIIGTLILRCSAGKTNKHGIETC
jgi:valyl-tRNA synthetase